MFIQVVNDNYCDRTDGSDETMTSACSNFPVKFTCSDGKLLFTSRVNDGKFSVSWSELFDRVKFIRCV